MQVEIHHIGGLHHQAPYRIGDAMANNLKSLREQRGWSQKHVADLIKTSPQQYQRLERGDRKLSQEWILKLSEAFVVDPSVIISAGLAGATSK